MVILYNPNSAQLTYTWCSRFLIGIISHKSNHFIERHRTMTNRMILCAILLTLFVSVHCQYQYNCRRMEDCKNSAPCDATTGECTCSASYNNYDCGMDTSLPLCVPNDCQNGGTCYTLDVGDTCFCPYGFYGDACELANVDVICSGNKAEMVLVFPIAFEGSVQLYKGPDFVIDQSCIVSDITEVSIRKFSIAIDISPSQDTTDTPCKKVNIEEIEDPTLGTVYKTTLRVEYTEGIVSSIDELYQGNCSHQSEAVLDKDIQNVAVDDKDLSTNEFADVYKAVDMVILDGDNATVTVDTVMSVGTVFKLVAHLTETVAFDTVRLESCTTNNTLEAPKERTFQLLDQGCPTKQSKRLTKEQQTILHTIDSEGFPAVELSIEAFKFSNSDQMGIVCIAKTCIPGDASCAPPADCEAVRNPVTPEPTTADTAPPPALRKRRAAGDVNSDVNDEETLSTVLTIRGPNDISGQSKSTSGTKQPLATVENCFTRSEILAVISVLAGIVCILLIACLMLACLLIKRKAKSAEFESMSVPPSDRFRIPRAHVNDAFTLREV